ncbi:MAG: PAS domain-containing protein [Planctomycetes bacterium]|nr:PAS domain-containing protein [Planctomycetota bacterium]
MNPLPRLRPATVAIAGIWLIALLGVVAAMWDWPARLTFSVMTVGAIVSTALFVAARSAEAARGKPALRGAAEGLWQSTVPQPLPARLTESGEKTDEEDEEWVERVLRQATALIRQRLDQDLSNAADLRQVFDAIEAPVMAFDGKGFLLLFNAAAVQFFGREPQQLRGRAVEELFTQADFVDLVALASSNRPATRAVRMPRNEGLRTFQVLASPVRLRETAWPLAEPATDARHVSPDQPSSAGVTHGLGAVMILRDITEQAQAAQLKTDFVANASHELRTPLAAIKAAIETLHDGAAEEPAMRVRFLKMIGDNTVRLEDLTRDLIDLSRLETPETELEWRDCSLTALCDDLRPLFEQICTDRNLTLEVKIDPAVEKIQSDHRLLPLIVKNLVDNATKFAAEGTAVQIVAARVPGPRNMVRLQVIDEGIGIPLAAQQRIFERFYQVDLSRNGQKQRRGTGLGLAIVKHAVKALGGTIGVESVWQQGTTMTVELPVG